jgi:RNase P subunit RPR2
MFARLVGTLLGCWHSNYSFPMTLNARRRGSNERPRTYVVCLDCGRELPYDWGQMRVVKIPEWSRQEAQQGSTATPLCDLSPG